MSGAASPRRAAKLYGLSYRSIRKLIDNGLITPHAVPNSVRSLVLFSELETVINSFPPKVRRRTATSEASHATA
jgi:hypothetical protein